MRFEFSIHVRINGSRYIARRISEEMAEYLEDATYFGGDTRLARAIAKAQGMTVEITGVTQIKQPADEDGRPQ